MSAVSTTLPGYVAAVTVGMALGGISILLMQSRPQESPTGVSTDTPCAAVTMVDDAESIDRIRALEQLAVERQAENARLRAELSRLSAVTTSLPEDEEERDWFERMWARRPAPSEDPATRTAMMVASGYTHSQAAWILQREADLQMAALESHVDGGAADRPADLLETRVAARKALRAELGDDEYERYLEATGQSSEVSVMTVVANSPAGTAGLASGDTIVNVDGRRVFNMIDVAEMTARSASQDPVIVDVAREGIMMQFIMPRGPLGFTGGRPLGR